MRGGRGREGIEVSEEINGVVYDTADAELVLTIRDEAHPGGSDWGEGTRWGPGRCVEAIYRGRRGKFFRVYYEQETSWRDGTVSARASIKPLDHDSVRHALWKAGRQDFARYGLEAPQPA